VIDGRLCVAVLAAGAVAVAGCGGGSPRSRTSGQTTGQFAVRPPSVVTRAGVSGSSSAATTCTVYEPGFATEVVFESQLVDVRGECEAWTTAKPGAGYLVGYETAVGSAAAGVGTTPVCELTDPDRTAAVSVIEDGGFVPISAVQLASGSSACARLLAAGWVQRAERAREPVRRATRAPERRQPRTRSPRTARASR
jgi:hypothetical protein